MPNPLYTIIDFHTAITKSGTLNMFQIPEIPFDPKRILIITDIGTEAERGGHTHHTTQQLLVSIAGSCTVTLENATEKGEVVLDHANKGLVLYPYTWHVMKDFAPGTILMVVADTVYDEKDYIRSYDDFKKIIGKA